MRTWLVGLALTAAAAGCAGGGSGSHQTLTAGQALAIGLAYTGHDSRIVQADLARIAGEIAG